MIFQSLYTSQTFLDSFSTMDFTSDYVIILRRTDILFDRLGGMRFLSTVLGQCFRWGTENTSANLHSKFARCTVTRVSRTSSAMKKSRGKGRDPGTEDGRLFADPYRTSLTP